MTKVQTTGHPVTGQWEVGLPRLIALLGGTTTLTDCMVGLRYLFDPRELVQGGAIREYEQAFAQQIGVRYAYSYSAGRVGLYGLLRALDVGPDDEVLLQAPTHIVVANAIRYTGARPVYVDCQPENYNMDLERAEQHITPRTKVLLLQHTFGIPVDMDAALDLAHRHDLTVVEDCVHALGATYAGRQVGSFGRAAFFSTEETKTISTTMGGMVVTDDPELADRMAVFQSRCAWPSLSLSARYILKLVLYHLQSEPYIHRYVRTIWKRTGRRQPLPRATTPDELRGLRPTNYEQRLSNAQAVLGLRQLQRLEANLAHRRANASAYARILSKYGFDLPCPPAKAEPAYVRYPLRVQDRGATYLATAPHAVLGIWFSSVLEESIAPSSGGYILGSCPQAEAIAGNMVNLPTHPRVRQQDLEMIASAVVRTASVMKAVGEHRR